MVSNLARLTSSYRLSLLKNHAMTHSLEKQELQIRSFYDKMNKYLDLLTTEANSEQENLTEPLSIKLLKLVETESQMTGLFAEVI